jgi:hypothetical protein
MNNLAPRLFPVSSKSSEQSDARLVKNKRIFASPVFKEEPMGERNLEKEGIAHGVQAEGIRIIILRRLFFPWVGPVPGRFARGEGFARSFLWSYFLAGLSLRRIGGKVIRKR